MSAVDPDLRGEGMRIGIVWSRFNEEIVRELLTACDRELVRLGVAPEDIGVITPYQAQVRLIRDGVVDLLDRGLEVSSVDGFQGREKLVIVVDLVRSNDEGEIGFLRDVRRMNVALTRARRWLMVLGDGALMARHRYYKGLLEHAENTGAWLSAWSDEGEALER